MYFVFLTAIVIIIRLFFSPSDSMATAFLAVLAALAILVGATVDACNLVFTTNPTIQVETNCGGTVSKTVNAVIGHCENDQTSQCESTHFANKDPAVLIAKLCIPKAAHTTASFEFSVTGCPQPVNYRVVNVTACQCRTVSGIDTSSPNQ